MEAIIWLWVSKVFGAFAGSAFSLAFKAPHSRKEAAIRLACGQFVGTVGSAVISDLIDKQFSLSAAGSHEREIIGAFMGGFAAWYLLDAVVRIINSFKSASDIKNREAE